MIFLAATGVPTENMLTVFELWRAAALVLLPCVNRINNQINSMPILNLFFMGVSDNLQDEINGQNIDMSLLPMKMKAGCKESIEMKDITYAHPNTEASDLRPCDLKIPVGICRYRALPAARVPWWIFCWDCWSPVRDISMQTAWM